MKRSFGIFLIFALVVLSSVSCGGIDKDMSEIHTFDGIESKTKQIPGSEKNEAESDSREKSDTNTVDDASVPEIEKNEIKEIGEIKAIFSKTATPIEYTVGEDRFDLDCKAFLFQNTEAASFTRFLSAMQERGFTLYTTNGGSGINGFCKQATLYNDLFTVNVTRYAKTKETYLTVEAYRELSPLQIRPEAQVYGTDTVYHNPEHPTIDGKYKFGELDIFELTNKHFVVVDGAQEYSSRMFVEYLEALAGAGNTPIIDAWFFTHAHPDHIYCCWGVGRDEDLAGRIRVNGFYYTWPNNSGVQREKDYEGLLEQIANLNSVLGNFKTAEGTETPRYKIHGGMVFYIEEIKAEVLMTQDQLMPEEYKSFNDSSTSFKFTVYSEGNLKTTFLIMGDAYTPVCDKLMEKYDYNTLHTNFFTSLHHGNNDCPSFFQFIAPDYLIYTGKSEKTSTGYLWLNFNCKEVFAAPSVIPIPYQGKQS